LFNYGAKIGLRKRIGTTQKGISCFYPVLFCRTGINGYLYNNITILKYKNMECRIEKNGTSVTITDVATGIGLCFTEGGSMQRYTASLYVPDTAILSTEEGVGLVSEVSQGLEAYAAERFPKEFAEIK